MSDDAEEDAPKKKSGLVGKLLPMVLALVSAGGAFYAVNTGMILAPKDTSASAEKAKQIVEMTAAAPSFVPLQPLMVTLGRGDSLENLRFEGYLEVRPGSEEAVTLLMPRVMDVLNGYLRAVEIGDLSDPSALIMMRGQMLRRIQTVVGEGLVADLLISKFLLS